MKELKVSTVPLNEYESFLKNFSDGPRREKGKLFLEIDLPDNPGAEDAIAEKIWRALHHSFFNYDSDDSYFCFEEALKAVNQVIKQENQKRESGTIGRINALASLLQENMFHFSQIGAGTVYLKRKNHISQITEISEEEPDQNFSSISSGELHPGDIVISSTRSLPFHETKLNEIFSLKESKILSELKSLSKEKDIVGLVSFFIYADQTEEVPEKSERENIATVLAPEKAPEIKQILDVKSHASPFKIKEKAVDFLKSKITHEKIEKVKNTLKDVAHGMGSNIMKIAKKPTRIYHMNRRSILMGLFILIVFLGILLVFQSGYRERAQKAAYYEDLLSQVKNNISIAETRFLIGEKTDAHKFLNTAETALEEISKAQFFQSDVEKLKKDIVLYRDNFDQILRVNELTLLADFGAQGAINSVGIIHTQDQKNYVFESQKIFESLLDKVQSGIALGNDEIIIAGAKLEDFNALVFLTQSGQIIEYSIRNGRFENSKTLDEVWKKGIDLKTFNGEFIYLLDPSTNSIWKYRRLRTGYSKASPYSTQGDLSTAISFSIDGDIYALLQDGKILKYRKGEILPFEIKDQPSIPLKNPSLIFTLPEANNLYVLDSAHKRIVVYSKGQNGLSYYQKQIIFDTLESNEIRDFSIDKDEQKLMILTTDKMYITDL